uniref:YgaP family membrane protein n=1 Tax=Altererythrobacter segetis TaxID=1104773 RepID=UPI003C2F5D74
MPAQQPAGDFTMRTNEGTIDRLLRIVVGVVLLALVFTGPHTPWGWLGVIPLATGLIGVCPLYCVLGINTCAKAS